ncbi:MAG TPA: hypothetical protein VF198_17090 [Vicinamibacterales bacterium]
MSVSLERMTAASREVNGAAMAAVLASGIGALAMGFVALLNEVGAFTVPALYAPAGGVTGRTTLVTVIWLVAWGVLHARWKAREIAPGGVTFVTFALTALGVLAAFPPVWGLL